MSIQLCFSFQAHRLHWPIRHRVRLLHGIQASTPAPVAGTHHAPPTTSLSSLPSLSLSSSLSLSLSLSSYSLPSTKIVKVWLATLLSFVIVTVAYALLTRHRWSKDPRFAFVDSEYTFKLTQAFQHEQHRCIIHWTIFRAVATPVPAIYPIPYYAAFVLGTLIDQSQHRLSGLKSNSLRLFTSIWLACILSITVIIIVSSYHHIMSSYHHLHLASLHPFRQGDLLLLSSYHPILHCLTYIIFMSSYHHSDHPGSIMSSSFMTSFIHSIHQVGYHCVIIMPW